MSDFITTKTNAFLIAAPIKPSIEIHLIEKDGLQSWLNSLTERQQKWVNNNQFIANHEQWVVIPDTEGNVATVGYGINDVSTLSLKSIAKLSKALPNGQYKIVDCADIQLASIGWALAHYKFDLYSNTCQDKDQPKTSQQENTILEVPEYVYSELSNTINSLTLVRKLISTPAADMGPSHLSKVMHQLADEYGAEFIEILDDDLLNKGFDTIHAVGRAATNRPRLLELNWGETDAPKVTLVGKGVCFDTGGLDIKPAGGMRIMKKDMGGAAHAIGLAQMIMAAKLNIKLRVLIPAVENNISADAFRPGDILKTYKGTTVEVDNTDAEGRLVLCDALALASEQSPDLLIDFATLTGAARVAMGLELVPFFTDNEIIAGELDEAALDVSDPLWRMPLYEPYTSQLKSNFADLKNLGSGP